MENTQSTKNSTFTIHPDTHIGHLHLRVSDIGRSLRYYRDLLGFQTIGEASNEQALLTVKDTDPCLLSLSKASEPRIAERHAGLYHFAVLLPDRKSLGSLLRHTMKHVLESNLEGAADHGVSEAIYLQDPDGNGIEIYRDRPGSEWRWDEGQVQMTTKSLDEKGLLNETKEEWVNMPPGTKIGHIHLHVSNLSEAERFYGGALGFKLSASIPSARFFAADDYHHHIAANTWLGEGVSSASKTQPGLDHFAIALPSEEALHHLLRNLSWKAISTEKSDETEYSHSIFVYDPDGIKIQLHVG
jgi:catechol 2,3-dioxygenase